jgi:hypothetical protein
VPIDNMDRNKRGQMAIPPFWRKSTKFTMVPSIQ